LFPRKCTYAKVIDLRNMVLWSIGLQIDIASPTTKSACVRYCAQDPQKRGVQCSCIGCIGLRPALLLKFVGNLFAKSRWWR